MSSITSSLKSERKKQQQRKWYKKNKEKVAIRQKKYREEHKEKVAIGKRKYRDENKEKVAIGKKKYKKKHKKNLLAKRRKREKERTKTDPIFILKKLLGRRINNSLNSQNASKNERTEEYVNCSVAHLYYHLESQFIDDMNWNNRGKKRDKDKRGWEIDHRRPCDSFDLNEEEQKYMCYHWTNLQPMWGQENNEKSNDYDPETFQYKWIDRETGWVGIPKYLMNN